MLARVKRPDRPLRVKVIRERDIDDIDARVGEKRFIGAEGLGDAVIGGEGSRPGCVATGNGDKLASLAPGDGTDEPRRNAAGAEDAPSEGGHATGKGPERIVTIGTATA